MKVTTDNLNTTKKVIELLIQIFHNHLTEEGLESELNALYSVQTILENSECYLIDEDNSK